MGISCLHCCEVDALELGRMPGELNRIAESDGPQEPLRRLGSSPAPRHRTSGTNGTTNVPAVPPGADAGGLPRWRAGWALQLTDGWRQQLPAEAGRVRSPQSAPVQPGTAGPCYRLRRRRGQSARGGAPLLHCMTKRPCHNLRRFWREVSSSKELFQNFRIVTTPVHVPQCF